jgi:hypothetical protein
VVVAVDVAVVADVVVAVDGDNRRAI